MVEDEFRAWTGAVEIALAVFAAHVCRLSPDAPAALTALTGDIAGEGEAATQAAFGATGPEKIAAMDMGLTLSGLAESIQKDATVLLSRR